LLWDRVPKYLIHDMTEHLAARLKPASGQWASGTDPHRSARAGRTDMLNA
jgi:hypothetical protein